MLASVIDGNIPGVDACTFDEAADSDPVTDWVVLELVDSVAIPVSETDRCCTEDELGTSPDTPVSETDCCCAVTELNESAELLESLPEEIIPKILVWVSDDGEESDIVATETKLELGTSPDTPVSDVDCCWVDVEFTDSAGDAVSVCETDAVARVLPTSVLETLSAPTGDRTAADVVLSEPEENSVEPALKD